MTSYLGTNFKFKRYKDEFLIENISNADILYSLIQLKCEDEELITVEETAIEPETTITLPILQDGFYRLIVDGVTIYFGDFHNYRNRLIELIKSAICEKCKCKPVNCMPIEAVRCLQNQSLFTFIQTYLNLIKPFSIGNEATSNPIITDFIESRIYANKCFIIKELCNQLFATSVSGNSNTNQELFNYYIAIYYLALYYYDVTSINGSVLTAEEVEEELEYLETVYDYKHIKRCIRNLGIDLNDILTSDTTNAMVYYWQLDNIIDTITQVQPIISQAFLDTQNSEPFDVFANGKIANYTLTGRVCYAIKDVETQNFLLLDSLGNDITNDFDNVYLPALNCVLYVSKEYYTPMNLYVKFKPLINV